MLQIIVTIVIYIKISFIIIVYLIAIKYWFHDIKKKKEKEKLIIYLISYMRDSILLYCTRHSLVKRITRESDYAWNCMTSLDTSSSLS